MKSITCTRHQTVVQTYLIYSVTFLFRGRLNKLKNFVQPFKTVALWVLATQYYRYVTDVQTKIECHSKNISPYVYRIDLQLFFHCGRTQWPNVIVLPQDPTLINLSCTFFLSNCFPPIHTLLRTQCCKGHFANEKVNKAIQVALFISVECKYPGITRQGNRSRISGMGGKLCYIIFWV